ncbi:MAG: glycosyltransferase [Candidatus Hodarchaeota archaeon]
MNKPRISIIIPTKNCGHTLSKCLTSIKKLDYPKDKLEVIIVDGHSTDNTIEIAKKYGCEIIFEEKGTISYARDRGIKYANSKFLAFTDADCVVERNWIQELLKHFEGETAAVGGPNITPEDDTEFGKHVGIILTFLSKAGARYGLVGGEVREVCHNPTCNVMYKKEILERVGGFNHKLITADDEELDYRIKKIGYKILYTPFAKVYHYRRPTWRKFIEMAWNYGIGRMQVIKLHSDMARWFHLVPSFIISLIFSLILLSYFNNLLLLLDLAILIIGGIAISLLSLSLNIKHKKKNFLTILGLLSIWFWFWGLGFIRGFFK